MAGHRPFRELVGRLRGQAPAPLDLADPAPGRALLYCVEAPGPSAADRPIQIMRTGTWTFPDYGKVEITPADIARAADNFAAGVRGQDLPVNIEHDRKLGAVGFYRKVYADPAGDKLWAEVNFTAEGRRLLDEGRFRYFSPELDRDAVDAESQRRHGMVVVGGALTNYPRLKRMAPILAASEAIAAELADLAALHVDGPLQVAARPPAPGPAADDDEPGEDEEPGETPADEALEEAQEGDEADDEGSPDEEAGETPEEEAQEGEEEGNPAVADDEAMPPAPATPPARRGGPARTTPPPARTAALAEPSGADQGDLPDSAFAYISPGGQKDAGGRTTPRALRHLPYRKADGSVDLPHLRNALARLGQTAIPAAAQETARKRLQAAAREHGVGDYADPTDDGAGERRPQQGGTPMDPETLAKLAKLDALMARFGEFDPEAFAERMAAQDTQIQTLLSEKQNTELLLADANTRLATVEAANDLMVMSDRVEALVREGKVRDDEKEPLARQLIELGEDKAEWLLQFLTDRPAIVQLGEVGSGAEPKAPADEAQGRVDLAERAKAHAKEHGVTYKAALVAVGKQQAK